MFTDTPKSHSSPSPETRDISTPGVHPLLPKQPQVFCPPECQLLPRRQVRVYPDSECTHVHDEGQQLGHTSGMPLVAASPAHANLAPLSGIGYHLSRSHWESSATPRVHISEPARGPPRQSHVLCNTDAFSTPARWGHPKPKVTLIHPQARRASYGTARSRIGTHPTALQLRKAP